MARQGQARPLIIMGVDPGEAWTGVAILECHGAYRAETAVLASTPQARTIGHLAEQLVSDAPTLLVCEQYHERGVGHARWSTPRVPRLLGAIEYLREKQRRPFVTVSPTDWKSTLPKMPIYPRLRAWQESTWAKSPQWEHAFSAWRILTQYLLQADARLLIPFQRQPQFLNETPHWHSFYLDGLFMNADLRTAAAELLSRSPV